MDCNPFGDGRRLYKRNCKTTTSSYSFKIKVKRLRISHFWQGDIKAEITEDKKNESAMPSLKEKQKFSI